MVQASAAEPGGRLAYDPAIDGLRAVAVLAVLLYHGDVAWASGGFLGVDLFFVLSGYLISTLLLGELSATGRIDLRSFWARRLRRLVPALVLVVGWVVVYSRWIDPSSAESGVRADAVASLFYVANWHQIVSETSYFALLASPTPLLHTWSLAIEEQWYVVWPLVMMAWVRFGRSRLGLGLGVTVAAAVASAVAMAVVADPVDPSRAFYGTDTRSGGLLVGAALAFGLASPRWARSVGVIGPPRWLGVVGLVGFAAVVAMVADDDFALYRGGFLAVSCLCAVIVFAIRTAQPGDPIRRLLSIEPLPAIGRLSYSLYLWHWPLFVWLTESRTSLDGVALLALRLGVTVVAALLSYHLVEQPIRRSRTIWAGPMPVAAGAALVALVAFAVIPAPRPGISGDAIRIVTETDGIEADGASSGAGAIVVPSAAPEARSNEDDRAGPTAAERLLQAAIGPPESATGESDGTGDESASPDAAGFDADPGPETVEAGGSHNRDAEPPPSQASALLLGDSVYLELIMGAPAPLRSTAGTSFRLTGDVRLGCGTLQIGYNPTCVDRAESWRSSLIEDDPDVVVVGLSSWDVLDIEIDDRRLPLGSEAHTRIITDSWEENLEILTSTGVPVLVVGLPCYTLVPNAHETSADRVEPVRTSVVNTIVRGIVERSDRNVHWVELRELTCPNGFYRPTLDGVPLHRDGIHFTENAVPVVWEWLVERLAAGLAR